MRIFEGNSWSINVLISGEPVVRHDGTGENRKMNREIESSSKHETFPHLPTPSEMRSTARYRDNVDGNIRVANSSVRGDAECKSHEGG